LIIPTIGSCFWFSVFGTSAFEIIHNLPNYQGEFDNVFSSIFVFLDYFPLTGITAFITILLLVGFLVTSVDSAVFVLSMFTDRGNRDPKRSHKAIWAVTMLLMTEAFLLIGTYTQADNVLDAMQKLLIISSLPFAFLTVWIGIRLIQDYLKQSR